LTSDLEHLFNYTHSYKHYFVTSFITRSFAAAKSTARLSCVVGVLIDIFSRENLSRWLINHVYLIGH